MSFPDKIRIIYLSFLVFLFISACGGNADEATEIHTSALPQIKLEHQFIISDSEEVLMQRIVAIKSDSKGRIFLADQSALQVHVFDSTGNYLTSIGRDGSGPGEFQSLLNIYINSNDQLFAYDVNQARNTVFVETKNTWEPDQIFIIDGHRYGIESADSDGNVVLRQSPPQHPEPGAYWYKHELAAGNLESGIEEQNVHTFKEMGFLVSESGSMKRIPFGRTTNLATDINGNIYLVWNDQFELAVYNAQMELMDSLSAPIPNQPVSSEERNEALDRLGPNFRSLGGEHIPENRPVISNMIIDNNRNIWLRTFDSPEYLVLDKEGIPLGSFDLENGLRLMHVDENRLYALKIGSEGYQIHVFEFRF